MVGKTRVGSKSLAKHPPKLCPQGKNLFVHVGITPTHAMATKSELAVGEFTAATVSLAPVDGPFAQWPCAIDRGCKRRNSAPLCRFLTICRCGAVTSSWAGGGGIAVERLDFDRSDQEKSNPR
jgi:hypothetical protein